MSSSLPITYTFFDLASNVRISQELVDIPLWRALVLARLDLEWPILGREPISLSHKGQTLTKADIRRMTEYRDGHLIRVFGQEAAA